MFRFMILFTAVFMVYGGENRAKRYYLDRYSSDSCIVTGNKLYVNSFYDHDLTSAEQTELQQYQASAKIYLDQLTAYNEQQEEIWRKWNEQVDNWAPKRNNRRNKKSTTAEPPTSTLAPPTPPTLPSFCSDEVTTQLYLSGCLVQHNKIYIGQAYARDLTSDEVTQLTTFNQQQKAYAEQWDNQWNSQLWKNRPAILVNRVSDVAATTQAPLLPPTQPKFCEAIVTYSAPDNWENNYIVDYASQPAVDDYAVGPAVDYGPIVDDYPAADYAAVDILPIVEDSGFAPQNDEPQFETLDIKPEPELTFEQSGQAGNIKLF